MATTNSRNPRRFAVVGAGEQAMDSRIPSLKALEQEGALEVVAVVDVNRSNAERASQRFGIPRVYDSVESMLLAEPTVGAVVNVTPHKYHSETSLECLTAGVSVLVEKPLSTTVYSGVDMVEAARDHEVILACGYQYPWQIAAMRRYIDGGALGNVSRINGFWIRRDGIPPREYWRDRESGGVGLDLGGHVLSAVFYLVDDAPEAVSARNWNTVGTSRFGRDFRAEDTTSWIIDWADGRRASIDLSWAANIQEEERIGVALWGDRGNLRIPLTGSRRDVENLRPILYRRAGKGGDQTVAPEPLDAPVPVDPECFVMQTRNFLQACLGQEELLFGAAKALLIQRVLSAALESARQGGKQVPLPDA